MGMSWVSGISVHLSPTTVTVAALIFHKAEHQGHPVAFRTGPLLHANCLELPVINNLPVWFFTTFFGLSPALIKLVIFPCIVGQVLSRTEKGQADKEKEGSQARSSWARR